MNKLLSQDDAEAAVSIIDVCASRGAFKGEELVAVGMIRTRLAQYAESLSEEPEEELETVN